MTWAIFSIVANDVSPSGCSAYTYAQYAYEPYVRAPFYQLSEQLIDDASINGGTHPAYPFLTGHGGANQVVLFGYLGLRLRPDNAIHIDPNLPPQLPHVTYRTFYWQGWPISASSNYTHTTLSRATNVSALDTADARFANRTIPVEVGSLTNSTVHKLPVNGPLTVPNRMIGSNDTVPGNLVQCRPVLSSDAFEPGQFPISVVDGASSTKWQPSSANMSSVTVSFAESEVKSMVSGFYFDWYQSPPVNATMIFHDKAIKNPALALARKDKDIRVIHTMTNIKQSKPYDPQTTNLDEIQKPSANTTSVELSEPVQGARYATLLISGNQANDEKGVGATVAEWAILAPSSSSSSGSSGNSEKRTIRMRDAAALSGLAQRRRQLVTPDTFGGEEYP